MGASSGKLSGRGSWTEDYSNLLETSMFRIVQQKVFHRNTNVTGYFDQGDTPKCFAYAAACAYINTCRRIYAPKKAIPTFGECYRIANYTSDKDGGSVFKAIELLESHFKFGVLCSLSYDPPSIRDILICSVVVSIHTSETGFKENIKYNGKLIERAQGPEDADSHAVLIEGYDFGKDCCICKNSWGDENGTCPRFYFRFRAAHKFKVTKVFYRDSSVVDKISRPFPNNISSKHTTVIDGYSIEIAYMDEDTANDTCEYLCERNPDRTNSKDSFIGFEVYKFVKVLLDDHAERSKLYCGEYYNSSDLPAL